MFGHGIRSGRRQPVDQELADLQYRLTLALYHVQECLTACAGSGHAIPREQVTNWLLDMRSTLTPPDPR